MKKVLLIIIDALTSRVVHTALKNGRLPNLQALADRGTLYDECTSVFPSLTLAATPSITTGKYPDAHGIMGAYWYDQQDNRVVYFGGDPWMVLQQGPGRFLSDFLVGLNHKWLEASTVFELVEQNNLHAASLNWFVYRGLADHEIDMSLLHLVPNAPAANTIKGPSTLHLGSFTGSSAELSDDYVNANTSLVDRLGFTDEITHQLLKQLAEEHAFPDFTLAYFPDNDFNSHAQGPESAAHTLTQFDDYLGQIFDAYGGIDQMLGDIAIIITGDHSQSNIVSDPNDAAIQLTEVLQDFSAAELGKGWDDGTDIILCPNGRVASIYHRNLTQENADQIIANLLQEPRIDQVIYSGRHLGSSDSGYHVVTRDRGKLQFEKASGQQETLHDLYGTRWAWRGDLGVFGETESDDNVTIFPEYPNPFERIAGILESSRSGHIWATARIGHDFVIPGIDAHAGGGSHGSLHSLDSSPPMFVAGTTSDIQLPQHPRSIDLVPLSLKILNIDPEKVE